MVRIKNRYLLIRILYPSSLSSRQIKDSHGNLISNDSRPEKQSIVEVFPENAAQGSTRTAQPEDHPSPTLGLLAPTSDAVNVPLLIRHLRNELVILFGEYGGSVAGSGLTVKYWSNATSTLILRCERAVFRLIWAACTSLQRFSIPNKRHGSTHLSHGEKFEQEIPCVWQVLKVSGTIRKCEQEAVRRAAAMCSKIRGPDLPLDGSISSDSPLVTSALESDSEHTEIESRPTRVDHSQK